MSNEQIIATLTERLVASINNRRDCGMGLKQAIASVRAESTAGAAVWANVEARFGAVFM